MTRRCPTACLALRLAGIGLAALGFAAAATAAPSSVNGLIVKLRERPADAVPEVDARLARVLRVAGLAARGRHLGVRSRHVDFGARLSREEAQRLALRLAESPEVEWVVPNERERRLDVPQDPRFAASYQGSGQWWLFPAGGSNANDIEERRRGVPGVQNAWTTSHGSAAAVVAVLDTGITAHPDLTQGVLPGRDFVSTVEYANDGDGWDDDPSDPGDWVNGADRTANPALFGDCDEADSSWHGTAIAGMLAADTNNGIGVAAINWNGRVLPVRVAGKCGADVADIVAGMRWAAGLAVAGVPRNPNPARVVSISFGGSAACNAAYQDAIDELAAKGVVVVAAAGNEHGAVTRPASCRGVVGVAALNRDGFKASYSNFGAAVKIATVGGDPRDIGEWGIDLGDDGLLTVGNGGRMAPGRPDYTREAGTSFAAPAVSGVIGLMLSANPSLSVAQIIDGLQRSARPHVLVPRMPSCSERNSGRCVCTTATCGAGILDAAGAMAYALAPDSYVAPNRQPEVVDNADIDRAFKQDGGGGGALGAGWLAALALAVAALSRRRPRSRARAPAGAGR
ncbi:S8 family peptidase [Piscinibacter sp.]|uniref:S8 family peptidase n=1 Tax=Piscinibacter sp. TaxID=1903157 RepID=UPI0039E24675